MKVTLFSPILIVLMMGLFLKGFQVVSRVEEQTSYTKDSTVSSMLVDTAYAQDSEAPAEPAAPKHEKKKADKKEEHSKAETKKHEEDNKAAVPPANAAVETSSPLQQLGNNMSASELKLLKELSKRRQDLDKAQEDFEVKSHIMQATEVRIDQKISEMKVLKAQIEDSMKKYNEKEKGKILSVVKIYENMKPSEAAVIFNELDMPMLVDIFSNMKETKASPIVAKMNPIKARDLSIELAKQKGLESSSP